jgi:hypothetical protein
MLFSVVHGYIREYTDIAGIRLIPIGLGIIALGVFTIVRLTREKGREQLTVISNIFFSTILVVSLVTSLMPLPAFYTQVEASPINELHNPVPDVYYIVPDTYTSPYVLSSLLGYDNSEFISFLEDRNFYVLDKSFSNYNHSILSISSVLNMRYWSDGNPPNPLVRSLASYLSDNQVVRTFKAANYTYVHIGSWWSFTSFSKEADITYSYSSLNELSFTLYNGTLWYDLLNGSSIFRDANLKQFKHLEEVSRMPESTFTFCHLIMPHPPFIFDEAGKPVFEVPFTHEEGRDAYLDQLTYTNKLLKETIDTILSNSEVTPIIIICADEGYSDLEWDQYLQSYGSVGNLIVNRPDLAIMRQGNFFAILNPYGTVPSSPVNIFPSVFNSIFSSNLTYLPDRYFLKEFGKYEGNFIDITEFING